MISVTTVRPAQARDRDGALTTLVWAFAEDPLALHLFGDAATRDRHLPGFLGHLVDVSLEGCEVIVADDLAAVSLWTPPGGNRLGDELLAERWQDVLPSMPPQFEERYAELGALVAPVVPRAPHWQLTALGVRPDRRRRGLGRAVCTPMLSRADDEAMPVMLETATASNLAFYEQLGFEVLHRSDLPGGPAVWTMWREPA
jgi:ribosomal protein S18 acetylase RimI-like enzyme